MKKISLALSLIAALAIFGCQHDAAEQTAKEEPLLLDDEPLLLLDDGPAKTSGGVDNYRCHVCHGNFATEPLSVTHAANGVGCETCHGSCDAHCDDEDNVTPPDKMYDKVHVNPMCLECHKDKLDAKIHKAVLAGNAPEGERYCTDCHFEHKMFVRTRDWDVETGELIKDDNVRMIRKQ